MVFWALASCLDTVPRILAVIHAIQLNNMTATPAMLAAKGLMRPDNTATKSPIAESTSDTMAITSMRLKDAPPFYAPND